MSTHLNDQQFFAALKGAKTAEDLRKVLESIPDPYVYRDGCDTGIFSSQEFRAICNIEDKSSAYWDLHLFLLETVKRGEKQVVDSAGRVLSIVEITLACNSQVQQPYQLVDLPVPEDELFILPCEILLPYRRPARGITLAT